MENQPNTNPDDSQKNENRWMSLPLSKSFMNHIPDEHDAAKKLGIEDEGEGEGELKLFGQEIEDADGLEDLTPDSDPVDRGTEDTHDDVEAVMKLKDHDEVTPIQSNDEERAIPTSKYLSFEKVLEVLKIDEGKLRDLMADGELRGFRDGRSMKFKTKDVIGLKDSPVLEESSELTTIHLEDEDTLEIDPSDDQLILEDGEESGAETESGIVFDTTDEFSSSDTGEFEVVDDESGSPEGSESASAPDDTKTSSGGSTVTSSKEVSREDLFESMTAKEIQESVERDFDGFTYEELMQIVETDYMGSSDRKFLNVPKGYVPGKSLDIDSILRHPRINFTEDEINDYLKSIKFKSYEVEGDEKKAIYDIDYEYMLVPSDFREDQVREYLEKKSEDTGTFPAISVDDFSGYDSGEYDPLTLEDSGEFSAYDSGLHPAISEEDSGEEFEVLEDSSITYIPNSDDSGTFDVIHDDDSYSYSTSAPWFTGEPDSVDIKNDGDIEITRNGIATIKPAFSKPKPAIDPDGYAEKPKRNGDTLTPEEFLNFFHFHVKEKAKQERFIAGFLNLVLQGRINIQIEDKDTKVKRRATAKDLERKTFLEYLEGAQVTFMVTQELQDLRNRQLRSIEKQFKSTTLRKWENEKAEYVAQMVEQAEQEIADHLRKDAGFFEKGLPGILVGWVKKNWIPYTAILTTIAALGIGGAIRQENLKKAEDAKNSLQKKNDTDSPEADAAQLSSDSSTANPTSDSNTGK